MNKAYTCGRRAIVFLSVIFATLILAASAPADGCACGNGGDPHAGESCIVVVHYEYGYPQERNYCWSGALGWHWH